MVASRWCAYLLEGAQARPLQHGTPLTLHRYMGIWVVNVALQPELMTACICLTLVVDVGIETTSFCEFLVPFGELATAPRVRAAAGAPASQDCAAHEFS